MGAFLGGGAAVGDDGADLKNLAPGAAGTAVAIDRRLDRREQPRDALHVVIETDIGLEAG